MEIEKLDIKIVSQFPIHPMLLLDLGLYYHFLLLNISYRRLISYKRPDELPKCEEMIDEFVQKFPQYYGPSSVSYNVHNMLHLVQCVVEFGDISSISAYKF